MASANGFDTFFETEQGHIVEMGGSSNITKGNMVIKVPFDFETDIKVIKNGQVYKELPNNLKKIITLPIWEPGVYRLEIYLSDNTFHTLPWILSNPIFIGIHHSTPLPIEPELKKMLVDKEDFFSVENNVSSTGNISTQTSDNRELITSFIFKLENEPDKKDFWSVMAHRAKADFSDYSGFVFEARGEKKLRFWIEFRTSDQSEQIWYRHSFLVEKNWKKYYIPFDKFNVHFGEKKQPDLTRISSIFFAINNAIAFPGTRGILQLKNIGLY
jgi:hypothetical protein